MTTRTERNEAIKKFNRDHSSKMVWSLREISDFLNIPYGTIMMHSNKGVFDNAQKCGNTAVLTRRQVLYYLQGKDVPAAKIKLLGSNEAAEALGISRRSVDVYLKNGRLESFKVSWGKNGTVNVFAPEHLTVKTGGKYGKLFTPIEGDPNHVIFQGQTRHIVYARTLAKKLGLVS